YPVLAYFRSQHDNQSWLAAVTTVLDSSALVIAGIEGMPTLQARLTFAMSRHALVDLSQVFRARPVKDRADRLPAADLEPLARVFADAGLRLRTDAEALRHLGDL